MQTLVGNIEHTALLSAHPFDAKKPYTQPNIHHAPFRPLTTTTCLTLLELLSASQAMIPGLFRRTRSENTRALCFRCIFHDHRRKACSRSSILDRLASIRFSETGVRNLPPPTPFGKGLPYGKNAYGKNLLVLIQSCSSDRVLTCSLKYIQWCFYCLWARSLM